MDRLSAHLDRSWDLISRGEMTPAMVAARQALELDRENPEVHNLIGYIHAVGGDFDDAIECYRRAIDLDEWYLEPILNAAELLVHPEADPDEAIRLCRRASQMVLEPRERADVVLIEVDALLNTGRDEEALECLGRLDDAEALPAGYQTAVGRILFDLGDPEKARPFVGRALEAEPNLPDAWYCLGLIEREEGRRLEAVKAFLETRRGDMSLPRLPWSVPGGEVEKLIREAMDTLDPGVRALLDGANIVVDTYPSVDLICDEIDPRQVVRASGVDHIKGVFRELQIFLHNLERVAPPTFMAQELGKLITMEVAPGGR